MFLWCFVVKNIEYTLFSSLGGATYMYDSARYIMRQPLTTAYSVKKMPPSYI